MYGDQQRLLSMRGCKYYVSFIDDHTRKVWVYFMKEKSEVFTHFKNFRSMDEKEIGLQIKHLRSDRGESTSPMTLVTICRKIGIQRQFTCRYTPHKNGVAERKKMHIAEICTCIDV